MILPDYLYIGGLYNMDTLHLLLIMIFLHICDDYYLQGLLAQLKQKTWWKQNAPDAKYKYDYIMALFMHSFSWSFMIMLPLLVFMNFKINLVFIVIFILNLVIHGVTDNEKANKFTINLIQDQTIHLVQIIVTYLILTL